MTKLYLVVEEGSYNDFTEINWQVPLCVAFTKKKADLALARAKDINKRWIERVSSFSAKFIATHPKSKKQGHIHRDDHTAYGKAQRKLTKEFEDSLDGSDVVLFRRLIDDTHTGGDGEFGVIEMEVW